MKTIGIFASCALGLLLAGCGDKAPAPGAVPSATTVAAASSKPFDPSKAAMNTLETTSPVISFATVQYDRATPNFVEPCYFVVKGIRTASLAGDKFLIDYKITYASGGTQVTKTATTRISESTDHVHVKNPDENQYISLSDRIDVTGQIPDDGATFTGTATLVKDVGGVRSVSGESILK